MYDVITIGSATQDVYLMSRKFRIIRDKRFLTGHAECFAFGTKVELDDILFEVGGGGTNTAVTFSRQGFRTAFCGKVGRDPAGDEVVRVLLESRVDPSLMSRDPKARTAYSAIFLTGSGERTILVYRGASHTLRSSDIPWPKLKAKWLYISSLAGNLTLLRKLVAFARQHRMKVALNPGAKELEAGRTKLVPLLRSVDVLLLNRNEASQLTGVPYADERRIVRQLDAIVSGIAVVTEGEKGSWVADGRHTYRIGIHPVKAVDTTGAGDAYGSGFVAGLMKRPGNVQYALRLATWNAASAVREVGAKHGLLGRRLSKRQPLPVRVKRYD